MLLDEIDLISPQHVLVFGPPKSGKTRIIGELANQYKLIWFDLENGKDTLRQLPDDAKRNITYIGIRDTIDAPRAHATIDKIIKGGTFKICDIHGTVDCKHCTTNNPTKFATISIPTESTIEAMQTIIVIDSASQLTMSVNGTITLGRDDTYKETFDDWAAQQKYLNRIFSYVQNAPFNIVMTAHEIEAEREDGSKRIVPSIGTKNYAVNSAKFFGHVIYMDKVNCKHRAWSATDYSNNVVTGSRLNVAVEDMDEPSLIPIFKGEIPAERTRKQQAVATLGSLPKSPNNTGSGLAGLNSLKKP